jgi:MFS superfamily sulfate permease-like transporter
MTNLLNTTSTWVITLIVALLVLFVDWLGFRLARVGWLVRSNEGPSVVVQSAAFTLVALLLGFSFSLALGRYDARRAVLVREANAINTTFLRTNLLDVGTATAIRADLRKYLDQRVDFALADADPPRRAIATEQSKRLQRAMWSLAMTSAQREPRPMTPLFVTSLNDTIGVSTEEADALEAHIPNSVIIGLVAIILIASGMMGYDFGRQGQRAVVPKALFALTLAIAIALVLDLDRPQRGAIRVNLEPLQTLQRSLAT